MKYILSILIFLSFGFNNKNKPSNNIVYKSQTEILFDELEYNELSKPKYDTFEKAYESYFKLKRNNIIKREYLTIIDFTLSSNEERMWVIDMIEKKVILRILVAHGKNSGEEFANRFSNRPNSFQSSLGTYITGETYIGKHGLSLRLDGLEQGINNNVRNRAIVIHGASYVSEGFIQKHNRLGRSQGCPAVSYKIHKEFINIIKDKSCLYIYHQ